MRRPISRYKLITITAGALMFLASSASFAQVQPAEGLRKNTPTAHVLTNARIVTAPGRVIPTATLVIREGIIEAVGSKVSIWYLLLPTPSRGFRPDEEDGVVEVTMN